MTKFTESSCSLLIDLEHDGLLGQHSIIIWGDLDSHLSGFVAEFELQVKVIQCKDLGLDWVELKFHQIV